MKFSKAPQSQEDHYALLKERGLQFRDENHYHHYGKTIGYYRLSGYMYPFQTADGSHRFKNHATFDLILDHYSFDKKLKILLLHEIETIEISFRSIICNTYALKHGAHWYLDPTFFQDANRHAYLLKEVKKYCDVTSESFITSYLSKYNDPVLPAAWMIFEILTFGQMASLYENLKDTPEKKSIALEFGTVVPILESWLKSINFIRNCSAHHSRIWNKKIPLKPLIPVRKKNRFLNHVDDETNKRIYGVICCMLYLSKRSNPHSGFINRLNHLFIEYPSVNKHYMGFPLTWKEEPLWKQGNQANHDAFNA